MSKIAKVFFISKGRFEIMNGEDSDFDGESDDDEEQQLFDHDDDD
jgi:hypothetical protein